MSRLYRLDGKDAVPCSLDEWGEVFKGDRRVARDYVCGVLVSTVFVGIDMQFGEGPPLVFETMAFGAGEDGDDLVERYGTWAEAEAGHAAMVKKVAHAL